MLQKRWFNYKLCVRQLLINNYANYVKRSTLVAGDAIAKQTAFIIPPQRWRVIVVVYKKTEQSARFKEMNQRAQNHQTLNKQLQSSLDCHQRALWRKKPIDTPEKKITSITWGCGALFSVPSIWQLITTRRHVHKCLELQTRHLHAFRKENKVCKYLRGACRTRGECLD
jgi:hypothetical protein